MSEKVKNIYIPLYCITNHPAKEQVIFFRGTYITIQKINLNKIL